MKFKLKITKEILDRSRPYCPTMCALAEGYKELVPYVSVGMKNVLFFKDCDSSENVYSLRDLMAVVRVTREQSDFITDFDRDRITKEVELEVEIPDEVIEYWHGDTVEAVQLLIDNPVLKPVLV